MKLNKGNNNLVFIVDDDEDDRAFIQSAIEKTAINCRIKTFPGAKSLIDSLPGSELPTFILMDLNMPVLNGNEALKILKADKLFSKIPVVIFSTGTHPLEKQSCLKNGAADFITKPSSVQDYESIARKLKRTFLDPRQLNNRPFPHYTR